MASGARARRGARGADRSAAADQWKKNGFDDGRTTMTSMAVTAKKLDVKIGDLVEIEGRKYDVVSDKHGGVTLEPAITMTADQILAQEGLRPLTDEEFEEQFGDLPSDGEG